MRRAETFNEAGAFFVETIKPMEHAIHAAMEKNVQLSQTNQTLRRRTLELAAANRQLKQEIVRRQAAEKALEKSQQHHEQLLEK